MALYVDSRLGGDQPFLEYQYEAGVRGKSQNARLRKCYELKLPVLYFYGVSVGRYRPIICHVIGDEPERARFQILPIDDVAAHSDPILSSVPNLWFERGYALATVRRRLHQDRFRSAVLAAYAERCAICELRDSRLLDAAHIVPDCEKLGEARVPNGLALCKLHHAAFDADILGVSAQLEVRLARRLLRERDGPMLEHGLRGFHGRLIRIPEQPLCHPDRDLLALRFARFRERELAGGSRPRSRD